MVPSLLLVLLTRSSRVTGVNKVVTIFEHRVLNRRQAGVS